MIDRCEDMKSSKICVPAAPDGGTVRIALYGYARFVPLHGSMATFALSLRPAGTYLHAAKRGYVDIAAPTVNAVYT